MAAGAKGGTGEVRFDVTVEQMLVRT